MRTLFLLLGAVVFTTLSFSETSSQPLADYHALAVAGRSAELPSLLTDELILWNSILIPNPLGVDNVFSAAPVSLGFSFPFNGSSYTQVRPCSNGFILLGPGANDSMSFHPDWNSGAGNTKYLAPYQTDLIIVLSTVHRDSVGGVKSADFRFTGILAKSIGVHLNFSATLYASGKIEYSYGSILQIVNDSVTVGLRGAAGTSNFLSINTTAIPDTLPLGLYPFQSNTAQYFNKTMPSYGIDIITQASIDAQAVSVDSPATSAELVYLQEVTPKATFKNVGWNDLANIPVKFEIRDGNGAVVYSQTSMIVSMKGIQGPESKQVSFPAWTVMTERGVYTSRAIVSLTADEVTSNDTASSHPIVTPVELVTFSARARGRTVQLEWRTATESNNYGFSVERADASGRYREIAFVRAASTPAPNIYHVVDRNLERGVYRYRLVQFDQEGEQNIISNAGATVSTHSILGFTLEQNYPNPFNPSTQISYTLEENSEVSLAVYDPLGRLITMLLSPTQQDAGTYHATFSGNELPSGTYIYKLTVGGQVTSRTMQLNK